MNLFVAAILEHFAEMNDFGNDGAQKRLMVSLGEWVRYWEKYDPKGTRRLSARKFISFMRAAPRPFGFASSLFRDGKQKPDLIKLSPKNTTKNKSNLKVHYCLYCHQFQPL